MDEALLDELCARCGIAVEYRDIRGSAQRASVRTRIALLNALGVPISSLEEAPLAAARLEEARWQRTLPAVKVVCENEPVIALDLTLADSPADLSWSFEAENGERHSGPLPALPEIDSRVIGGRLLRRYRWELPLKPATGYHTCAISPRGEANQALATSRLIVCPAKCYSPPALENGARLWGPALQLYAIRSARNWGMGDWGDLEALIELAARSQAAFIGLNPLHALDVQRPAEASPYSPSSRTALNILYLDVERLPDFQECRTARERVSSAAFQEQLTRVRGTELVDYPGVARLKLEILELLYAQFRAQHLATDSARARAFRSFEQDAGEELRRFALFEALQEHFHSQDANVWGWPVWPEPFRDPNGEAVRDFYRDHQPRVEYFEYLQWQANLQLSNAREQAQAFGVPLGFYQDLAVGAGPGGSDAWSHPRLYSTQAAIGAPPDEFNLQGQDWGLPAPVPQALQDAAYQPFTAMLRACMRHARALRIDHVMGLMRLYWVPRSAAASEGTYVAYPFRDLLGILALESCRNTCLVIGEDLGTVPDEVRSAMREFGILSYRPFYFQRSEGGAFQPPERYPRDALVSVSTHDLPTLQGFWRGVDLSVRQSLGLFPDEQTRRSMMIERAEDRVRLMLALEQAGLEARDRSMGDSVAPELDDAAVRAVHEFLSRTPAKLLAIQLEDVFGQLEQVNLPASGEGYPNWRRKLALPLEEWTRDQRFAALAQALARERASPNVVPEPVRARIIPSATYRWQFNREFTFRDAVRWVPYLAQLGISHVYASSYLKARPGSPHGYDIVDHNAFNPEIGSERDFEELVAALRHHGMSHILDLVPNHMGVLESDNAWWLDVLENAQASRFAGYFDIDWNPANKDLRGKVLLPVLGEPYGAALESGRLKLAFDPRHGEFSVVYFGHRFPIDPREYPRILARGIERLAGARGSQESLLIELRSLLTAFGHLPDRNESEPNKIAERARDKELRKSELAALSARWPALQALIEASIERLNGRPGDAASFDELHELIESQGFSLAHWRVASDDINYRRFFDINDLAALRMESEPVFEDTHRLVLGLVRRGAIQGLRIDHPDGLQDPKAYLERLQQACALQNARAAGSYAACGKAMYLVVEKILTPHESLAQDWPVDGTTGYRFVNLVNGLFIDRGSETEFDRLYERFSGEHFDYEALVRESKRLVMVGSLSSELNRLATLLKDIARSERQHRDFTYYSLRNALQELVANFPVYRTYIDGSGAREADIRVIDSAVGAAKKRSYAGDAGVQDFIRSVLLGSGEETERQKLCARFVARFQQFTAPVMAKALEDRVFYIYTRLASLNEVGGEPRMFGLPLAAFHAACRDGATNWPHTMLATSTHDTKRSEDVRARIDVLSEMPGPWRRAIARWSRINRGAKTELPQGAAPSRNDEYLLYQTLLGAWPVEPMDEKGLARFRERVQRYLLKAVREAKVNTSWLNPDQEYEAAVGRFVQVLLGSLQDNAFLADFTRFAEEVLHTGLMNSLSQTLIKITAPGVPDFYQGNELWDFSLVDPDNRRAVDYAHRLKLLEELARRFGGPEAQWPEQCAELLETLRDGRAKLYVTWKALQLRIRLPALFRQASYLPLAVTGSKSEHLCAFARVHEGVHVVTLAPRLNARLAGERRLPLGEAIWGDARIVLPGKRALRNLFTGERLEPGAQPNAGCSVGALLANFPVALLAED